MCMCLQKRAYTGEQQGSQSSIHNVHDPVPHDDAQQAKEDEDNQADEHHAITGSEIILGLWRDDKHAVLSYTAPSTSSAACKWQIAT